MKPLLNTPPLGLVFGTVSLLFGLQVVRAFCSGLLSVLRDGPGTDWSTINLLIVVVVVFGTAILAPVVRRFLGNPRMLVATAGGLGIVRLAMQLVGDGNTVFWLSMVGVVLAFWFVPAWFSVAGGRQRYHWAIFPLAFLLDSLLFGIFVFYDYLWVGGWSGLVAAIALFGVQFGALSSLVRKGADFNAASGLSKTSLIPFWGLGIALMPQIQLFHNLGRHSVVLQDLGGFEGAVTINDGISYAPEYALLAVAAGVVVGLIGTAKYGAKNGSRLGIWMLPAVAAVFAILTVLFDQFWLVPLGVAGMTYLVGVLGVWATDGGTVKQNTKAGQQSPVHWLRDLSWAAATLMAFTLLFAYYGSFDINIGFDELYLVLAGTILVVVSAVACVVLRPHITYSATSPVWLGLSFSLVSLLLLIGVAVGSGNRTVVQAEPTNQPVVLSYNIHFGWANDGSGNLEQVAAVIERSGAQVVFLQETTRGWYVGSSPDALNWLQRRLNMRYAIYASTAGDYFGNSILSNLPINPQTLEVAYLPNEIPSRRNLVAIEVDTGLKYAGQPYPVTMVGIHLRSEVTVEARLARIEQIEAAVDILSDRSTPVIVGGDFNSTPDSPIYATLRVADFFDTQAQSDYTGPVAYRDGRRIDYIWYSQGDGEVTVVPGTFGTEPPGASDHPALWAKLLISPPALP